MTYFLSTSLYLGLHHSYSIPTKLLRTHSLSPSGVSDVGSTDLLSSSINSPLSQRQSASDPHHNSRHSVIRRLEEDRHTPFLRHPVPIYPTPMGQTYPDPSHLSHILPLLQYPTATAAHSADLINQMHMYSEALSRRDSPFMPVPVRPDIFSNLGSLAMSFALASAAQTRPCLNPYEMSPLRPLASEALAKMSWENVVANSNSVKPTIGEKNHLLLPLCTETNAITTTTTSHTPTSTTTDKADKIAKIAKDSVCQTEVTEEFPIVKSLWKKTGDKETSKA